MSGSEVYVKREAKSWAHAVRPLTAAELETRRRLDWGCSRPRCEESPTHEVSYRYVTGRAGRVTTSQKTACQAHAERFAVQHNLTVPEASDGS